MKNELQKHKLSDKIKWILTGIAFVLVFAVLAGLCMQIFAKDDKYKPSNWFAPVEESQPDGGESETAALRSTHGYRTAKAATKSTTYALAEVYSAKSNSYSTSGTYNLKSVSWLDYCEHDEFTYTLAMVPGDGGGCTIFDYSNSSRFRSLALRWQSYNFYLDYKYDTDNPSINDVSIHLGEFYYSVDFFRLTLSSDTLRISYSVPNSENLIDVFAEDLYSREYFAIYKFLFTGIPQTNGKVSESITLYQYAPTKELPPDPVKEGYTFAGWYYDSELTQPYDNKPIFEDIELYAKFEINQYTVVFNSNGGSEQENIIVDWNTTILPKTPTKKGYTFVGWFYSNGIKYENQPITDNTTLVAHWAAIMCTVTFYVDGELYQTKQVEYGSVLTAVIEIADGLGLQVMSFSLNEGEQIDDITENGIVSGNISVSAAFKDGADKVVTTVKNNKWQIIGGVAGGIALIAVIAAACSGGKRKSK